MAKNLFGNIFLIKLSKNFNFYEISNPSMNKDLDLTFSDIFVLAFLDILTYEHVDDPKHMVKYHFEFKGSHSKVLLLVNESKIKIILIRN